MQAGGLVGPDGPFPLLPSGQPFFCFCQQVSCLLVLRCVDLGYSSFPYCQNLSSCTMYSKGDASSNLISLEEVSNCQLQCWYEKFEAHTIPTKIVSLSDEFVDVGRETLIFTYPLQYLLSDGATVPSDAFPRPGQYDSGDEEWSSADEVRNHSSFYKLM